MNMDCRFNIFLTKNALSIMIYTLSAGIAQLVEQVIRNDQVVGSNPIASSI